MERDQPPVFSVPRVVGFLMVPIRLRDGRKGGGMVGKGIEVLPATTQPGDVTDSRVFVEARRAHRLPQVTCLGFL